MLTVRERILVSIGPSVAPRTALVNEAVFPLGYKKLLSLRKASWVFSRHRAFVGLFVGPECAVLVVGEKIIFTRR